MRTSLRTALSLALWLFFTSVIWAAPVHTQTGNLILNGSLELGSFVPISGHDKASAASYWNQWQNSNGALTSKMITEAEMLAMTGQNLRDGQAALRVSTTGGGNGVYTWGHPLWTSSTLPYTLSGWAYVLSGSMAANLGSNWTEYAWSTVSAGSGWTFFSVTHTGITDEICIYSGAGAGDFIVDDLWLNAGTASTHPNIPEPATICLLALGGLMLRREK